MGKQNSTSYTSHHTTHVTVKMRYGVVVVLVKLYSAHVTTKMRCSVVIHSFGYTWFWLNRTAKLGAKNGPKPHHEHLLNHVSSSYLSTVCFSLNKCIFRNTNTFLFVSYWIYTLVFWENLSYNLVLQYIPLTIYVFGPHTCESIVRKIFHKIPPQFCRQHGKKKKRIHSL